MVYEPYYGRVNVLQGSCLLPVFRGRVGCDEEFKTGQMFSVDGGRVDLCI